MSRRAAPPTFAVVVAVLSLAAGCAPSTSPKAPAPAPTDAVATRSAVAVEVREALPFIHDDYARALAEAKRTKRPIFVDAWAPWCHSCQSMRAFVLTDPSLAPLANDFVWLTIDTEKDSNAAFVGRFTNRVWPTLWIVDAERESPVLQWEGTATAAELRTLLSDVRELVSDGSHAGAAADLVAFLRANQAASRGDAAEAERTYRELAGRTDSAERERSVEALVGLLASKKDHAACAQLAVAEAPRMKPGTSRATLLATGLSCARDAKRSADVVTLAAAAEAAANDPDPRTIDDDRSALFEELVETKKEQGDEAGAKAVARRWAAFLEGSAARATTKQARAVFDPHRLSAYLAAGEPERAIPMLSESERDFPDDYNTPARLARAYLEMKRLDDAQAAIGRACARVYGPRSLRVFVLAAEIARARGDLEGEVRALQQALARTANVVLNENQRKARADIERRLRRPR